MVTGLNHKCSSKQLVFKRNPEFICNVRKFETSISTYNTNNEKMNITVLSGRVNRVKLKRFTQPGASECGRWPY